MAFNLLFRRCSLVLFLVLSSPTVDGAKPSVAIPEQHRRLLNAFCIDCHNSETQEGGVRLDDLDFVIADIESAERWQKVLDVLNSGEMPPESEKQPQQSDKATLLEHLSSNLVLARRILNDQGGAITMRRLNRREYENTIHELLGVRVNVKTLPSDTGGGFDTEGKSLFFSSDQFEQYFEIAKRALDEAILIGDRPETTTHVRQCEIDSLRQVENTLSRWTEEKTNAEMAIAEEDSEKYGYPDIARAKFMLGQAERRIPLHEYLLSHPLSQTGALLTTFTGYVNDKTVIPADSPPGRYLLRVRVAALPEAPPHRRYLEFGQHGTGDDQGVFVTLGCYQVSGTPDRPQTIEIPVDVPRFGNREFLFQEREGNDRAVAAFNAAKRDNGTGILPTLWLDSVQWEGPIVDQWPAHQVQQLFFKGPEATRNKHDAREIIERFAIRAFRGSEPSSEYLDRLVSWFEQGRGQGLSFEEALKQPLAIVLASPSFLYLTEASGEAVGQHRLTPLELASRLSYFLWSAPPDDDLMWLAKNGELSDPIVLAEQVERMIDDPRFWGFVTGFNSQWLHMERLDLFQFDAKFFPTFDRVAKLSARDEVFHTFQSVVRDRQGIGRLLKSDFVVVNAIMADHYGLEGVAGDEFRRVDLPPDSHRGGLLGMAAVLAMGSDGERSSPVERGAFVLRKLLHAPPPPAPANVPQLSRLNDEVLPARQRLSAHMEEAQCSQCHRKIDPIGFGLENFDAAGIWRDEEFVASVVKGKEPAAANNKAKKVGGGYLFPIDASGQLPDGAHFADFFQLRDLIASRSEVFARGFTEALMEYALGRPYGFTDQDLVNDILASTSTNDFQPRAIIRSLVLSETFQRK